MINYKENIPYISVIIPVYNVERYLEDCIESVINQTYKKLDIILIDDGSSDCSGDICDKYSQKDNRIHVIHKRNEGLGKARNEGLKHCVGSYVTFVDSDDKIEPELVEELYKNAVRYSCDTVIGGFKRFDEEGNILYLEKYDKKIYSKNIYEVLFGHMVGSLPDKHDSIRMSVWNALYSLDIIRKHDVCFLSEREYLCEDLTFDEQYYKYSKRAIVISSSMYLYRINQNSLSNSYSLERFRRALNLFQYMKPRVENLRYGTIRLQKLLLIIMYMCITQEGKKNSHNEFKGRYNNIKQICNNSVVREMVESYPYKKLAIKQKFFFWAVKNKLIYILMLVADLQKSK